MKVGKIFKIDFNYCDGDGGWLTYQLNKRGPRHCDGALADGFRGRVDEILDFCEPNHVRYGVHFQDGSSVDIYNPNQVYYEPDAKEAIPPTCENCNDWHSTGQCLNLESPYYDTHRRAGCGCKRFEWKRKNDQTN